MIAFACGPILLVALAVCLDRLVGDPRWCPHPVVLMGWWIRQLRSLGEAWAGDWPRRLRLAGGVITLLLVLGSGLAGWALEILCRSLGLLGVVVLLIALASALAGRSLEQAVQRVLEALSRGETEQARLRLAWIVGRDTDHLDADEMMRAAAETASENAVDGLFAPLFWMLVGAGLWLSSGVLPDGNLTAVPEVIVVPGESSLLALLFGPMVSGSWVPGPWVVWPPVPGPLSLAWMFKAASTLDSMLGYRQGRLRWLGTAGARLDDGLTWLPCRLVAVSLPLVAGMWRRGWGLFRRALAEGRADPSPNAGVSQAIYALTVGVRLGGVNRYGGVIRAKPLLAADYPSPDRAAVLRILALNRRLEIAWLAGVWLLSQLGPALLRMLVQ